MKMEQKIEVDKLIFDFVYELALRDAVMRTAYKGDKSELRKCQKAKIEVRKYANSIFNEKSINYYDVAKNLCYEFNYGKSGEPQFTFGNAQKLLNMTMKYLYITCYKNDELREKFKNCHCPMDRIMIDKVKKEFKNCSRKEKDEYIGKFKDKPWSKLTSADEDIDAYKQFQDTVKSLAAKQKLFPLEYDYLLWNN